MIECVLFCQNGKIGNFPVRKGEPYNAGIVPVCRFIMVGLKNKPPKHGVGHANAGY